MNKNNKQFNLQEVLYLSGNPYESQKSYDKTMGDIYWAFESNPLFSFQFRRDIIRTNISISDSVYERIKER